MRPNRLESLTGLRFLAATSVVLLHTLPAFPQFPIIKKIFGFGWLGVTFFFILSGFVLTWSRLHTERLDDKHFLARRLSRIYPLHLLFLILSIVGYELTKTPWGGYGGTSLFGTISNSLLVHGWIPLNPNIRQGWNGVSWTLSLEFFFYLTFGSLYSKLKNSSNKKLIFLGISFYLVYVALIGLSSLTHNNNMQDMLYFLPLPRIFEFIYGIILAFWLSRTSSKLIVKRNYAWIVLISSLMLAIKIIPSDHIFFAEFNCIAIPGFLLLIFSYAQRDLLGKKSILNKKIFQRFGEESFALYISHVVILSAFCFALNRLSIHGTSRIAGSIMTIFFLLGCMTVARILHDLIEKPTQAWFLKKLASK